jgi:hypothetical protein
MYIIRLILFMVIMGISSSAFATKLVYAEISHAALKDVKTSLYDIFKSDEDYCIYSPHHCQKFGFNNLIVTPVTVLNAPKGHTHKLKLEVIVGDELIDSVMEAIMRADQPYWSIGDVVAIFNVEQNPYMGPAPIP